MSAPRKYDAESQERAVRMYRDRIAEHKGSKVVPDVWPGSPDAVRRRARGARFLLEHLAGFPGRTWQQRWEASGLKSGDAP